MRLCLFLKAHALNALVAMTAQEAKDSDSSEDGDLSPDTPSTVSPTDTEVLLNSSNSSDIGTLSGGA